MFSWLEVRRSAEGCRVQRRTFVTTASIYLFGACVGYVTRLSFPGGECGRHCPDIQIECSVRIATQPSRRACYACRSCEILPCTAPIMRSTELLPRLCRAWCDLRKRCWLGLGIGLVCIRTRHLLVNPEQARSCMQTLSCHREGVALFSCISDAAEVFAATGGRVATSDAARQRLQRTCTMCQRGRAQ
jgi:hypothetical protein